ncbi:hypothetical protein C8F01DRAFT_1102919 [Mycena amicta]|nr:hypothetical protein C8F01DRAFT_1102919 [Mycena amicta]
MNSFLDPYDLTSGTPPRQSDQSLEQEVSQAIGQVGRLWGAFRKQSQNALETVVSQAQQELSRLTMDTPQPPPPESTQPAPDSSDGSATPRTASPATQDPSSSTTAGVQNLFSRLQSALPPNIVSTVQSHIPESLKNASENIDFAQMRTTLTSEFQRVQGVTRAQAEEYVHKSEALLRDAMKEASEVLRDAVKVVPPDAPQTSASPSNMLWDGTDMWMMPFDGPESNGKGKEKAASQSIADSQLAVATRAEVLLKRLQHDPEIIKLDPEADAGVNEIYSQWLATSMTDGLESEEWASKITALLDDSPDGQALKANQDSLVPAEITRQVFWKRYFFRVHQIKQEEEKRKALLQRSTAESEEDFSWEDDEEAAAVSKPASTDSDLAHTIVSVPSSEAPTPASTSPRESSEESYDVVSSDAKDRRGKKTAESDDNDSDWE